MTKNCFQRCKKKKVQRQECQKWTPIKWKIYRRPPPPTTTRWSKKVVYVIFKIRSRFRPFQLSVSVLIMTAAVVYRALTIYYHNYNTEFFFHFFIFIFLDVLFVCIICWPPRNRYEHLASPPKKDQFYTREAQRERRLCTYKRRWVCIQIQMRPTRFENHINNKLDPSYDDHHTPS